MDNNEEQLEEQPEMLDESIPYEEPQEQNNQSNNDGLLSGRNAYQNTLGNKDYYKDRANELNKQRNELKKNHEEAPKNLEDAKKRQADARQKQEEANKRKQDAKDNGDKAEKKDAKKEANAAKKEANAAKKEQKQIKKNERHYKQNLRNNKLDQITNKINAAKEKGYRARHPLEAGKEKGKQLAKQGAKKIGEVAKKGIQAIWKAMPPDWKVVIIGVLAGIVMFFILFTVLLTVFAGDSDGSSSNYLYEINSNLSYLTAENASFIVNMNSPISNCDLFNLAPHVSSYYGWRGDPVGRSTYRFHNGLDFGYGVAEGNTEVLAVANGTVTAITNESSCGGNIIEITHENGYKSRYMHLLSYDVSTGEKVSKGEKIGLVGGSSTSTENGGYDECTTGAHLHFELKDEKGEYIDINILAGFSDENSLSCINKNDIPTDITICGEDYKNLAQNRSKNTLSLEKIVAINNNSQSYADADVYKIIEYFEGSTPPCTVSGVAGYEAVNIGDGVVTLGAGFTNHEMNNPTMTKIIDSSGYSNLFSRDGNHYLMKLGSCIPQTLAKDLAHAAMDLHFNDVEKEAAEQEIVLNSYQVAALASTSYRTPAAIPSILAAYKNYTSKDYVYDGNPYCTSDNGVDNKYAGAWCKWSLWFNSSGNNESFINGVKKRLKTEFAYFVTGDVNEITKADSRLSKVSDNSYYYNYCSEENVCAKTKNN